MEEEHDVDQEWTIGRVKKPKDVVSKYRGWKIDVIRNGGEFGNHGGQGPRGEHECALEDV